jgi:poly(3-hydroxybutyrate) depolymerase
MKHHFVSIRRILMLTVLCTVLLQTKANSQATIGRQKVDQYPITPWGTPTYGLTWLPTDYNSSSQKYPLIIFLHGRGETGDGVGGLYNLISTALPQKIAQGWDPKAVNPADGQTYQFIVVSPQAPSASAWSYQYGHIQFILKDVMSRYRVDPDRVYVTGLSAGGAGTWSCVTNGPEGAKKFAAIVPVSSAGLNYGSETDSIPHAGSRYGVKVWQVCGAEDAWYSFVNTSTNLYNSGSPAPEVRATQTGLPGIGHTAAAWNTAYEHTWRNNVHNKNIFEWMLQYKRSGNNGNGGGNGPSNHAPKANAGSDQSITLPNSSVQLSGSGTDNDGSVVSYSWSKVSGPQASFNPSIPNPLVTGLVAGNYVFRLTVTDNLGATDTDEMSVTVNTPPIGSNTSRVEAEHWSAMKGVGTEATNDAGGGLSVGWIDNTDWMDYSINVAQGGKLKISFRVATPLNGAELEVRNSAGSVLAKVKLPKTGGWQDWKTVKTKVELPAGQQTIRIVSTDSDAWNFNWMEFEKPGQGNQPPLVTTGSSQVVTLPVASVQLTANAQDEDGSIESYQWSKVNGPAAGSLSNSNAPTAVATGLAQGTYTFRVTVTDDEGSTTSADQTVVVNGAPSGGPSTRVQAENFTSMKGVGTENTSDAGGGLNVGWIDNTDWMDYSVNIAQPGAYAVRFRVATPAASGQLKLQNAAGATLATLNLTNTGGWQTWQTVTTNVTLPAGQQTLRVVSTSADGWNFNWFELAEDEISAIQLPTVNAGADQTIALPANSVQLNGSGTTGDGSVPTYSWIKVSGPAAGNFSATNIANPVFGPMAPGVYTLRLTVGDNSGTSATDEVMITVNTPGTPSGTAHRIEAERWSAMSGVGTETTTDAGGGLNVGWIDNHDWMDYSVNLDEAGRYTVRFRVAAPGSGAKLQLKNANGNTLATVNIPNTGGWQNWQTVSVTVTLPAGQQTLRVVSTKPNEWNFNWFELAYKGTNGDDDDDDDDNDRKAGSASSETDEKVEVETATEEEASTTKEEKAEVYPNPVSDRFVLKVSSPLTGTMQVQVVNMNGAVQKQYSLQKSAGVSQSYLSAQGLAKGEYLLRVQIGQWTKTVKLIKL